MAATDSARIQSTLAIVDKAVADKRLTAASGTNIKHWLTATGYAPYVPRILPLIDAGKFDELETLFWEVIPFGTGGRRGLMGEFGSATMNDRTIAESANGLAVYLQKARGEPGGRAVIAYDTRHRSRDFARITAVTLAAHGLKVFLFDGHRSTPTLSFAVRHLGCDVGVMISASHNPPSDNGVKAYWSSGAQVLPPHDKGIIDCVYQTNEIPTADFDAAVKAGQIELIGESVDAAYVATVLGMSLSTVRELPAIYTPLHGVGETSAYRVLKEAGFKGISIFEPQRSPDGDFPNVPNHFPNPELPIVFDPPIAEAKKTGAELVLASDPDADRLGVCVKDRQGNFVHLTGNRIGALLADYILKKRDVGKSLSPEHFVVTTLVTTELTPAIAKAHGVRGIHDLLVGFKYIAQVIDREGPDKFVFATEESIGYLAGTYARDKDASIAALYMAECAAELRQQGKTLLDRLDELYAEHGYYFESQKSETCKGPQGRALIGKLLETFATKPPQSLAGIELARVRDYARHEIRSLPDNRRIADLPEPQGDLVIFESKKGDCEITFAARPSGTEPKIKIYFFAHAPCPTPAALPDVKARTEKKLGEFQTALSAWVNAVWAAG